MAEAHQVPHGFLLGQIVTLLEPVEARYWNGHDGEIRRQGLPEFTDMIWSAGSRVKVVCVSRFWWCGITTNLDATDGYEACVSPGILLTDNESAATLALRTTLHQDYLAQQAHWAKITAHWDKSTA